MYAYPSRFTDAAIEAIAAGERIVPLRGPAAPAYLGRASCAAWAGASRAQATRTLMEKLRTRVPEMVIRTTFIVGFPGETDEQFEELLDFVKDFRFDALGVFEYSPEEGTPAARLSPAIPADVRHERARQVMLAQRKIAFAAARRMTGRRIEVLVDGPDPAAAASAGITARRRYR